MTSEHLETFGSSAPTPLDHPQSGHKLASWYIAGFRTRDSDTLVQSNFACILDILDTLDPEGDDYSTVCVGHWGPGWLEYILVRPGSPCQDEAEKIVCALADYPVLNDEHHSELEMDAANETWANCYSDSERVQYMRDNRYQFECRNFAELLGCARGHYFAGYAPELIY